MKSIFSLSLFMDSHEQEYYIHNLQKNASIGNQDQDNNPLPYTIFDNTHLEKQLNIMKNKHLTYEDVCKVNFH